LDEAEEMNKSVAVQLQQESESSGDKLNESIKNIQTLTQINQALQQKLDKHEEEHLQCGLFMDQVTAELALLAKDNQTLLTANQELNSILLEMETDAALNEERARKALIDLDQARAEIVRLKDKHAAGLTIIQLYQMLVSNGNDPALFSALKEREATQRPTALANVSMVTLEDKAILEVQDQTLDALIVAQEEPMLDIKAASVITQAQPANDTKAASFKSDQQLPPAPAKSRQSGKMYTFITSGCVPSSLAPSFRPLSKMLLMQMRTMLRLRHSPLLSGLISHVLKTKNVKKRLFQDQLLPLTPSASLQCHPLLRMIWHL
jgi:hypothetical protein